MDGVLGCGKGTRDRAGMRTQTSAVLLIQCLNLSPAESSFHFVSDKDTRKAQICLGMENFRKFLEVGFYESSNRSIEEAFDIDLHFTRFDLVLPEIRMNGICWISLEDASLSLTSPVTRNCQNGYDNQCRG